MTDETLREAERLRALWQIKARPSQAEFGELYEIGNQSAVGQFLRGVVPLSLKAARGFARGLGVEIADFSTRLATEASALAEVSPPRAARALSFLNLRPDEARLVALFRELKPTQKVELERLANEMHADTHPRVSSANPYAKVPRPSKREGDTERPPQREKKNGTERS